MLITVSSASGSWTDACFFPSAANPTGNWHVSFIPFTACIFEGPAVNGDVWRYEPRGVEGQRQEGERGESASGRERGGGKREPGVGRERGMTEE